MSDPVSRLNGTLEPPVRKAVRGGGHDTTSGPILKVLVTLAVPIVATNIFQSLYQLIDTFWVGRLGAEAVAAVSLSFPILFFMISAGGGMSIAVGWFLRGSWIRRVVDEDAGLMEAVREEAIVEEGIGDG